jgi:SAM-dependent methyltransferase
VTVLDVSARALELARADLGEAAAEVNWVEADVRSHDFGRRFDLWHDRGVFHFMVEPADRDAYLAALERTLRPGGHLILATFGPQGPTTCSGLPVHRYDAESLTATLGGEYEVVSSRLAEHRTPSGRSQQLLHAHMRRLGAPSS